MTLLLALLIGTATGDAVVSQMEAAGSKAKTLSVEYEVTNKEAGKDEHKLEMKVLAAGGKKLFEFIAPADMKGLQLLILSPAQMYVYLPAFGKVRRLGAQTKDRGFLGLAFSQDDLATKSYGATYSAAIASEDAASWKLVLTPRPGQAPTYKRIEVTVAKDDKVPHELKYFDAAGKNIKTESRTGYDCEGQVCTPGELKMVDNVTGAWTKLLAKSRKVNAQIAEEVFSQRNLGR